MFSSRFLGLRLSKHIISHASEHVTEECALVAIFGLGGGFRLMRKLELDIVKVDDLHVGHGRTRNDHIRVDGEDDGAVAAGQIGCVGERVVVSAVVVGKKRHTGDGLVRGGNGVDLGQDGCVDVSGGSLGGSRRVEALHQRPCAMGDGWLGSRTVGSGETAGLRVLLLLRRTAGSSEELLVFGRKDGAGRAMRLGKSAGKL